MQVIHWSQLLYPHQIKLTPLIRMGETKTLEVFLKGESPKSHVKRMHEICFDAHLIKSRLYEEIMSPLLLENKDELLRLIDELWELDELDPLIAYQHFNESQIHTAYRNKRINWKEYAELLNRLKKGSQ